MITFVPGRIWIEERPQRFFGLPMGTRMTLIKLASGGLFVHSPVAPDEAVEALIAREGPVRFVIAPNRLHHLYLTPFLAAYPEAELWIVEELVKKRRDLAPAGILGDAPEPGWADEIDQCLFAGSIFQNEAIFLDKPSGTLIVVDDFLADAVRGRNAADRRIIEDFRRGWRVPSFDTVDTAIDAAAHAGLRCVERRDLTPLIRLDQRSRRLIAKLGPACRRLGLARVPFFANLIGGGALHRGLADGLFAYRWLRFERAVDAA